ncbi:MAG: phage Gp37/Gp68 family protein [Duncaniella sp.]|nr:phage Gp37/Gp68 family protein [Duncaniella sp.]MDE6466156.1 phage Gp37/Gp68 family protein [Duncaniella sp.]
MWNPWHGCHKISAGCRHCYVYREDAAFGSPTPSNVVRRTASFDLPLKRDRHKNYKFPTGTTFGLCFTSDLLIEEADEWRGEIWDIVRERNDCTFLFFTKRIDRLTSCLPSDWGNGYENVTVGCTVENQDRADRRLPIFLSSPLRHRIIVAAPLLERVDLRPWLDPSLINEVTVGGESGKYARPLHFDWVTDMQRQCNECGVAFTFHQTGSYLVKDGRQYHIPREHQHSQAKKAGLNTII